MEVVHLFLNVTKTHFNGEWNKEITEAFKALPSAEKLMVIENGERRYAQLSLSYNVDVLSFSRIEQIVVNSGAIITEINIHFPPGITGVADPYGASAVSILIEERFKKLSGVLCGAISSQGELKVALEVSTADKQRIIRQVLETYFLIKSGKGNL